MKTELPYRGSNQVTCGEVKGLGQALDAMGTEH